jgi:hypothetical protein
MAATYMVGFEGQAVSVDLPVGSTLQGTSSYNTSTFRTGAAAVRCNPASGASGYLSISGNVSYQHFAIRVATLPSVDRVMAGQIQAGQIHAKLTSSGAIAVYLNTTLVGTSTTTLSTGTWYWIGLRYVTGTSVVFLQIEGIDEVTGTATVTGTTRDLGFPGTEASAVDAYIDDIIGDDTGFISNGKVDLALPISDNTVTGVTDNNGVTTNIFDCVNNTPPAGVASANEAANPKAGMHFPASVTCNYLANLETYTTLGIGASDTVLAVQGIVRHGEDIATGTKNLQNVAALTNPTVSGVSVTAGSDGGAHGAEAGLWVTTSGTLTTSPSVTLGTSPTIRTSRTSESRVACADFMGMNVAWTPAAAVARVPKYQPMPQLLAH